MQPTTLGYTIIGVEASLRLRAARSWPGFHGTAAQSKPGFHGPAGYFKVKACLRGLAALSKLGFSITLAFIT